MENKLIDIRISKIRKTSHTPYASLIAVETRAPYHRDATHCIVNIAIDELSNARMLADNQPEIVSKMNLGFIKCKFIREAPFHIGK